MAQVKQSSKHASGNLFKDFLGFLLSAGGAIVSALLLYKLAVTGSSFVIGLISLNTQSILPFLKVISASVVLAALGNALWGLSLRFIAARKAAQARDATERVVSALSQIKARAGQSIAEVSTQQVAESLKGDAKINKEQLARLVDQQKQQLLIDDEYFRAEVSSLIVDYLQPLPRNAKRLLNRFRVNLLIAHSRGLLTSEPKVTAQQIGKWLVLMERWPQLGRSLSASPAKLQDLEQHVASPVLANPDSSASDAFMDLIRVLAPPYQGDEDLRKFIHSEPALARVAQRMAHYGTAELPSQ